ncbi:hypothetical protein BDV96DRAFT_648785 [Lophiotrema nucula]|uniref:Uncharacterized protein n=1 Tax=Lophiotrema nucula TaxID=690887 RepID=A0A6A5Z2A2_9PLEO|nr:hypothetical protein BDV96DRAFT_648785 [Lophiotrema nucula]
MNSYFKVTAIVIPRYLRPPASSKATIPDKNKPIFDVKEQDMPVEEPARAKKRRSWFARKMNFKSVPSFLKQLHPKSGPRHRVGHGTIMSNTNIQSTSILPLPEQIASLLPPQFPNPAQHIRPISITFQPSFREIAILNTPILAIAFIAHTKMPWQYPLEPTHTNHWTIFLKTSDKTGVSLNYDGELRVVEMECVPKEGRDRNCERVVWLSISKIHRWNTLASSEGLRQSGTSVLMVQTLIDLASDCIENLSSHEFGSRSFVLQFLDALIKHNIVDGVAEKRAVKSVRQDVRKLWSHRSPLPLEDEVKVMAVDNKEDVMKVLLQTFDHLLLVGYSETVKAG